MTIHRHEVYYADLSSTVGSEQFGIRPVVVIQNNIGNRESPTIIVAPITTQRKKLSLLTHVQIRLEGDKTMKNSVALLEQIRTIDKSRLKNYVGILDEASRNAIESATLISLGLDVYKIYRRLYGE